MAKRRADPGPAPPRSKRARRAPSVGAPDQSSGDEVRPDSRRPPTSRRPRRHPAPDDDDDDDHIRPAEPQPRRARDSPPAAVEDDASDHHADPEDDEESPDDEPDPEEEIRRARRAASKGFSTCGILHSVRLDRFMSHDCFQYDLAPNVNFVNGRNGSGKSAIIAALQVGLLGSVTVTERAKKLEDLIKHGSNSCIITIKIWNRKPPEADDGVGDSDMTYRHDLYGDVITVERRLYRSGHGTNSFAVKARNKRVQLPPGRTARQEIQAIVDHFGFMVDNPVAVLTQTKSKEFLAKGKPADNYRLYRKATLLGPLEDELSKTKSVTAEVEGILKRKEDCRPEVEANLRKKEAAHREAQEMKNIGARIKEAELLLAWTCVQEDEHVLHDFQTKTREMFEPAAEKARQARDKSQRIIEEKEQELFAHTQTLKEATQRLESAKSEFRDAQKSAKAVEMDISRQNRQVQEYDAEIESMRGSIIRTKQQMEKARKEHFAGQEQKSRLLNEVQDIESAIEQEKNQSLSERKRESDLREEKLKLGDDATREAENVRRLEKEFEDKRRDQIHFESLARSKSNLARFGDSIPDICRRISQKRHQFHRHPIGPIGRHVKIDDDSWAPAVECAVGQHNLRTFIVHDAHDSELLESCFPSRGYRPTILIANVDRDRYAIRQGDMPDVVGLGHRTILDTISIDHNAAFNFLVDQSQVERNVLNGTDDDITRLGWSRLPNLQMVWNKACDRAYTRNGSNTFRQARGRMTARVLTKDMGPFLQGLRSDLQTIEAELREGRATSNGVNAKLREVSDSIRVCHRNVELSQTRVTDLTKRKGTLEDQLSRAENAFDPAPFEQDIATFEENIREAETHRKDFERQIREMEEKKARCVVEAEQAKAKTREVAKETSALHDKMDSFGNDLGRLKSIHKQTERDLLVAERKVRQAHEEVKAQNSKLVASMETARSFGSCPENVDREENSSRRCEQELKKLKSMLETEQQRRGGRSAQEIEKDYLVALHKDEENRQVLERIKYYVRALNKGIRRRQEKLHHLMQVLKKLVRGNFRNFLSKRGHEGKIQFSVDNGIRELHLVTRMASHLRGDGERHTTGDMKALSGGEKSFTTLSFILALAELCHNPLRVMDEVDCFQDDTTRRVSYKETVNFFTSYLPHRQIIIITPLQIPVDSLQGKEGVKIVRLEAPRDDDRRRQTNLDEYGVQG